MSSYSYNSCIIVLPEDRANEEIANGFREAPNVKYRAIKVERPAGGWVKVVEKFTKQLVPVMRKFLKSLIILLIDFDERENRLSYLVGQIPDDLKERVFVLGVLSEPEKLKTDTQKTFEKIGEALAKDCPDKTSDLWEHDLLKHNKTELDRIINEVKPFLFN